MVLFDHTTIASIASQLDHQSDQLRCAVAPTTADPLTVARAGSSMFGGVRYLKMANGTELVGLGAALRLRAAGLNRFGRLVEAWDDLPAIRIGARFMMGFSFSPDGPKSEAWDGFEASDVVLPEVAVIKDDAGHRVVVAVPGGADARALLDTARRSVGPGYAA